jgi:hypothetical protein
MLGSGFLESFKTSLNYGSRSSLHLGYEPSLLLIGTVSPVIQDTCRCGTDLNPPTVPLKSGSGSEKAFKNAEKIKLCFLHFLANYLQKILIDERNLLLILYTDSH